MWVSYGNYFIKITSSHNILYASSMFLRIFHNQTQALNVKRFMAHKCSFLGSKMEPFCAQNRFQNRLTNETSKKEASEQNRAAGRSRTQEDGRGRSIMQSGSAEKAPPVRIQKYSGFRWPLSFANMTPSTPEVCGGFMG